MTLSFAVIKSVGRLSNLSDKRLDKIFSIGKEDDLITVFKQANPFY